MNILEGTLSSISSFEGISLVQCLVGENMEFAAVIIGSGETNRLSVGQKVSVLFKETEVIIAKGESFLVSVRNQVPGTVTQIKMGEILCEVSVVSGAHHFKSIITKDSAERLRLAIDDPVVLMIKSTEISLSSHD